MAEQSANTRKEQILTAAAKLFHSKGFGATTVRDIASEMNMEAASLYHHIKSKEEILEIICFSMAEKFLTTLHDVNDIYFNAEEKLRLAIKNHVEIITNNLHQSTVFLRDWTSLSEPKLSEFKKLRAEYEQGFKTILSDGVNEDVFDDVDKKFAVLSILSSVNWITEWYNPNGKMKADEISKRICNFVMSGLRKKLVTDI